MEIVLPDEKIKQNIADNVRRLLRDRHWSQAELAKRTGENTMAISTVCGGKHVCRVGAIARIAEAFDVSIDRLVDDPPESLRESA